MSTQAATIEVGTESNFDVDSWLGTPGAESVIIGDQNKPPKQVQSILADHDTELPGFDIVSPDAETTDTTDTNTATTDASLKDEIDAVVGLPGAEDDIEDADDSQPGAKRKDKSVVVNYLKTKIEKGEYIVYDDFDEKKETIDEYLAKLPEKEIHRLMDENVTRLVQKERVEAPGQAFEALPDELKVALQYVGNGGQDLKGLFNALAQVEQVRDLDPSVEHDQEVIVRQYLQATSKLSTPAEIEEDIQTWKDGGLLEKKAASFKPKLDALQEEVVTYRLKQQEVVRNQQIQAAEQFAKNVYDALKPGELNGIKLNSKIQNELFYGLSQANYESPINNRPTNELGYLLEMHQVVKPNYPLIAEALWLLKDPEAYKIEIRKQGSEKANEQIVRQLRTEQGNKNIAATQEPAQKTGRISKKPLNIFEP